MMDSKRRIVFVDDEPNILSALRRSLGHMSRECELSFVRTSKEALQIIEQNPIDIVVTDVRMPEMDGVTLLSLVRDRSPGTIRMVFSGQANRGSTIRALNVAHRYESKPCESEVLQRRLSRICTLCRMSKTSWIKNDIGQTAALICQPQILRDLKNELSSSHPSIDRIAELVSSDVAATAKVLQIANSSFFSNNQVSTTAAEAVMCLGIDFLHVLVENENLFFSSEDKTVVDEVININRCSLALGNKSLELMRAKISDESLARAAFTVGMLKEVGRLVLLASSAEKYLAVNELAYTSRLPLRAAERKIFGVSHREVGAYLLGLWGLPGSIVNLLTCENCPMRKACENSAMQLAISAAETCCDDNYSLESDLMCKIF